MPLDLCSVIKAPPLNPLYCHKLPAECIAPETEFLMEKHGRSIFKRLFTFDVNSKGGSHDIRWEILKQWHRTTVIAKNETMATPLIIKPMTSNKCHVEGAKRPKHPLRLLRISKMSIVVGRNNRIDHFGCVMDNFTLPR